MSCFKLTIRKTMNSSSISLQFSLHLISSKLLLFSLILSASFIKTGSIGLTSCHGNCSDPSIAFSFGIFVLAPVLASTWIVWTDIKKNRAKLRANLFEQNGGNLLMKKLSKCKKSARTRLKLYTAEDMRKATNNYSDKRVMKRCNPGTFYRGTLPNNYSDVVIMKIGKVPESQIKQFVDELIFLSQPHRNLVKILGCCLETSFPLLVYELYDDGNCTLFDCLHDEALVSRFSCEMRVKAATGAARGVAYLHSQNSRAPMMHGNISSGNILVDDSFDAKVFYAVASNLIPQDMISSTNCVYKDPEFISLGRSKKSDVYSFGVVLVELLIGGKAFVSDRQENYRNLALDLISNEGSLSEVLDDQLVIEENAQLVIEVATVAARCLSVTSKERPNMKEVQAKLTALMKLISRK